VRSPGLRVLEPVWLLRIPGLAGLAFGRCLLATCWRDCRRHLATTSIAGAISETGSGNEIPGEA
jgi:hypothetical protein